MHHRLRTMNNKIIDSYPIEVSSLDGEEGGGYQALFPPIARSVVGYGPTPQEATADLYEAVPLFLQVLEATNQRLPRAPVRAQKIDYSGKFNVRVPKALHRQLVELAGWEGVSLNSLTQTLLAAGVANLAAGNGFKTGEA